MPSDIKLEPTGLVPILKLSREMIEFAVPRNSSISLLGAFLMLLQQRIAWGRRTFPTPFPFRTLLHGTARHKLLINAIYNLLIVYVKEDELSEGEELLGEPDTCKTAGSTTSSSTATTVTPSSKTSTTTYPTTGPTATITSTIYSTWQAPISTTGTTTYPTGAATAPIGATHLTGESTT